MSLPIYRFKLDMEARIAILMSYAREEMAIERSLWTYEDDSHGIHYERAIKFAAQAEGLREALQGLKELELGSDAKDPFDLL